MGIDHNLLSSSSEAPKFDTKRIIPSSYYDDNKINSDRRIFDLNKILNIMLVDDEQDILYNFKVILSDQGYNVKIFISSKEALRHFIGLDNNNSSSNYDLVITDIRMPDINDIQLYQILKIIAKNIKVLFVSALDAAEITGIFPEIKSRNMIKKPVSEKDFIERVQQETMANQ